MGMDTSVHVACGMMQEWEAMALGEQLETRTLGVPRARSGSRGYPDHNRSSDHALLNCLIKWCKAWTWIKGFKSSEYSRMEGMVVICAAGCWNWLCISKPHTITLGCWIQRSGVSANIIVHNGLRHTRVHYYLNKCDHSSLHVKWIILSIHMPKMIQFKL